MDREKLIQKLLATFVVELDEHVRALNRDLIALEKSPPAADTEALLREMFRTAHSLKGAAHSVGQPMVEAACHEVEEMLAGARNGRLELGPSMFELLYAAADALQEAGLRVREKRALEGSPLETVLQKLDAFVKTGASPERPSPQTMPPARVPVEAPNPVPARATVRVDVGRLDELLARAGELMVARRRASQRSGDLASLLDLFAKWKSDWRNIARYLHTSGSSENTTSLPVLPRAVQGALDRGSTALKQIEEEIERVEAALRTDAHLLDRAAAPLEEDIRRVRMLPFADACMGLDRTVRDASTAAGKEVDLEIAGGDVEIDRSVLEGLRDPLLHLVRNAVAHGIEKPAERRMSGKSPRGLIRLAAGLRGSVVEILVTDDGRGIDLERVRTQAVRMGMVVPDRDEDVARLILAPGFSTDPQVTGISGRGVGLDVVMNRIEALHGTLSFSFAPGLGVTFRITVPLTLTSIRALLVKLGSEVYGIPATGIERIVRAGVDELRTVENRETLLLGGAPVPIARLDDLIGAAVQPADTLPARIPFVVIAAENRRIAVAVDELLSEQEITVKNLGPRLQGIPAVAGGTVLPTGRVSFILNTSDLVRRGIRLGTATRVGVQAEHGRGRKRKKLLVAEDSVTTRTLVKSILESAGYDVVAAADGAAAWSAMHENDPDLVVTDIDMPRMDGVALTAAIRGSKRFKDVPVILVTALETDADRVRGLEAGADAYLRKSAFDQRSLLETIARLV